MRTLLSIVLSTLFFFSPMAYSKGPAPLNMEQLKELSRVANDFEMLYNKGISIHSSFNLENMEEAKECNSRYRDLLDASNNYKKYAKSYPSTAYKFELILLADLSYQCVSCWVSGAKCLEMPKYILELKDKIKTAKSKLPPSQ